MKSLAVLIAVSSWACIFLLPGGTASRVLQLLVFGLLGSVLTIAGAFQYWWNASMLPSQKSALILICGLLTLLAQAGTIIYGIFANEGGTEWEPPTRKRR